MTRRRPRRALVLLAAVAGLAGCGGDGSGSGPVPSGDASAAAALATQPQYVGMVDSELLPLELPLAEQRSALKAQAAAGVGLLRQTFRWDQIEPEKGAWSFGAHDRLVESAARAGITVLPIVFAVRPGEEAAPKKNVRITETTTMPPRDMATFAQYATVLVERYGRGGSFWSDHPDVPAHPMTAWQVWNEPNIKPYWGGRPNPIEYTAMLRVTSAAIRAVDPDAEIVTGGIPDSEQGSPLPDYLKHMVQAGAEGTFDTLAVHPYSKSVDGVISRTEDARNLLDRYDLGSVDLRITEVGWATGGPKSKFTVGPRRQAELVAELLQRTAAIAPQLRLRGVVYYGWRDVKPTYAGATDFWGNYTGLLTEPGTGKPALATFAAAAKDLQAGAGGDPGG